MTNQDALSALSSYSVSRRLSPLSFSSALPPLSSHLICLSFFLPLSLPIFSASLPLSLPLSPPSLLSLSPFLSPLPLPSASHSLSSLSPSPLHVLVWTTVPHVQYPLSAHCLKTFKLFLSFLQCALILLTKTVALGSGQMYISMVTFSFICPLWIFLSSQCYLRPVRWFDSYQPTEGLTGGMVLKN